MAITKYDYYYDAQIKRFLLQVVRAFSGFQYMTGARGDRAAELRIVPCSMARRNRQVAAIQRNMSENTLLSVPMITIEMAGYEQDRERLQNPNHVDTVMATERSRDAVTGEYTNGRGNRVSIDRLMPRPFMMTVQVDIWTATQDQKHQLLEQISQIMMPSFDIQNSDNALDWSALTTASWESLNWTSASIPIGSGGENEIDIATIVLKIPMWLSPPANMRRQVLINQVITNIAEAERDENNVIIATKDLVRNITTPGNHSILLERGYITLLGPHGSLRDDQGAVYRWDDLLAQYGKVMRPSETEIRIRPDIDDDTKDIIGVIQPTGEGNVVVWQPDIDTLPRNTMASINGVLDPMATYPDDGNLPPAAVGQRYLLINDLVGPNTQWGISARSGSIIEYRNGQWLVAFNPIGHETLEYVVNQISGAQLKWHVESQDWVMAIDATYPPGMWRLGVI